jgi:signal transduction histidine kinase
MSNTPPLSPELLVPRLGDYLVEKGLVKPEDLVRALEFQKELRAKGDDRLIGQIMVDMNLIDDNTRNTVVTEMILQLRTALQEANHQLTEANQELEHRVQERTAELQRAMEKLAEVNQLKANIVANISHELRTPLTHLKGYLELLLSQDLGSLNEQQQSALIIMNRSGERLGRLIEDLIMFSTSEHDKISVQWAPIHIPDLFAQAVQKAEPKAKDRQIKLVINCEKGIPDVQGDVEKISWVVLQFVDNAIKFSHAGGTVTLRATHEGHWVNISVLDTGIGIPTDRISEVFDSFHQLDGSTTRRAGGTGLGLALAKRIVEAHGSIIQVTSEVGQGSCFSFSLNLQNPGTSPL